MCCLTCTYFDPTEPVEHKVRREAGLCEAHCGNEWSWHTALRYVQSHAEPLHGVCRFNPEGVQKSSWGVCGQHKPVLNPQNNGWGITEYKSGAYDYDHRGLMEWARQQYLNIKEDKKSFDRERVEHLEEVNQALRKQLTTARKRSASRLARLQKAAKAEPKPVEVIEAPAPQPVAPLRLVANG